MATDYRLVQAKQVYNGRYLSHGDDGGGPRGPPNKGLGGVNRFDGCLFPHPDKTLQSKVPEVYPQGRGISVPGSPLRDMHGPSNLHHRDEGGEGHAATKKR